MFDDLPTSEHWSVTPERDFLSYEHVLAEAGEPPLDPGVLTTCKRLRAHHAAGYYSDLLFALTHKRYPLAHAEEGWTQILRHRDRLTHQLGRNPGIAVAALDYLTNIEGGFTRPTLIDELKLARLVDYATHDGLTGLYDRESLRVCLKRALAAGAGPVSVIMIDLDHFKQFNDTHGHLAGDQVLVRVSALVREAVRNTDVAARYGGEELCVLLPGKALGDAVDVAERLRARIADDLGAQGVTASMGVASYPDHATEPLTLLGAADAALYVSKRSGRNRVCVSA